MYYCWDEYICHIFRYLTLWKQWLAIELCESIHQIQLCSHLHNNCAVIIDLLNINITLMPRNMCTTWKVRITPSSGVYNMYNVLTIEHTISMCTPFSIKHWLNGKTAARKVIKLHWLWKDRYWIGMVVILTKEYIACGQCGVKKIKYRLLRN